MWHGAKIFDPVLIVAQIFVLQCVWYISLGCLLWLLLGALYILLFSYRMSAQAVTRACGKDRNAQDMLKILDRCRAICGAPVTAPLL